MKSFTKTAIAGAVLATIGGAMVTQTASAAVIDGYYNMVIITTPININTSTVPSTTYTPSSTYTTSSYNVGTGGNWNSTFTFGGLPGSTSNGMIDTGLLVTGPDAFNRGSSIGSDGWAGSIGIHVTGGGTVFSVGGTGFTGGFTGNNLTFTPTGRLGAIDSPNVFYNAPWNIAPSGSTEQAFSTVSATNSFGTIAGKAFVSTAAQNADTLTDYLGVLVSGGSVGTAWGAFSPAQYMETWRVRLISSATPTSGFSVDTIPGTAGGNFAQYVGVQNAPAVPVPAAAWLLGSGMLGLVGVARRKKSA